LHRCGIFARESFFHLALQFGGQRFGQLWGLGQIWPIKENCPVLRIWSNLHYEVFLLGRQGALSLLSDQRLVDVRDDPASSNRCLDQRVQLLVSTDRQLEMSRGDPLHLQILGCVAGQLEHLGGEILEDGRAVDGRSGSNSAWGGCPRLEVPVDPADWKLKSSASASWNRLLFCLSRVFSSLSSSHDEQFRRGWEAGGEAGKLVWAAADTGLALHRTHSTHSPTPKPSSLAPFTSA